MIKCAENTIKVGRYCIQGGEKKSTYHTQLFPHLRKAKGKKQMYFKYFKILSQQIEFMKNTHFKLYSWSKKNVCT